MLYETQKFKHCIVKLYMNECILEIVFCHLEMKLFMLFVRYIVNVY